jgi:hypothetical protein
VTGPFTTSEKSRNRSPWSCSPALLEGRNQGRRPWLRTFSSSPRQRELSYRRKRRRPDTSGYPCAVLRSSGPGRTARAEARPDRTCLPLTAIAESGHHRRALSTERTRDQNLVGLHFGNDSSLTSGPPRASRHLPQSASRHQRAATGGSNGGADVLATSSVGPHSLKAGHQSAKGAEPPRRQPSRSLLRRSGTQIHSRACPARFSLQLRGRAVPQTRSFRG